MQKKIKNIPILVDHFLKASQNYGKVGAFEGAGYQSTWIIPPDVRLHNVFQREKTLLCGMQQSNSENY